MSDGDEVEAIAPSHLSPMDFSGNCCRNAVTPTRRRMSLAHHANCRTFPRGVPLMFCQFLLERLAMWPRGHISNRMRSASFALRLLRQCERGPRCTLLPDQLDFARGRRRMHGAVHGRRDPRVDPARGFLACREAHMRCRSLAMAAAIGLALRGTSLAADPRFPDWPCNQIKVPDISICRTTHRRRR
jgi:hypothetical protein